MTRMTRERLEEIKRQVKVAFAYAGKSPFDSIALSKDYIIAFKAENAYLLFDEIEAAWGEIEALKKCAFQAQEMAREVGERAEKAESACAAARNIIERIDKVDDWSHKGLPDGNGCEDSCFGCSQSENLTIDAKAFLSSPNPGEKFLRYKRVVERVKAYLPNAPDTYGDVTEEIRRIIAEEGLA